MSRKVIGFLVVGLCCGIAFLMHRFAPAEEPSRKGPEITTQFTNGVLLIKANKSSVVGETQLSMFTDAKLVKIGERYFVRGKAYLGEELKGDKKYEWYDGVDMAVAWDSVAEFTTSLPSKPKRTWPLTTTNNY